MGRRDHARPGAKPCTPKTSARQSGQAAHPARATARKAADPSEPPDFLSAYARDEWRRVAPELHRLGLVTTLDVALLAVYCTAYARWRTAEELLAGMDADARLGADFIVHGSELLHEPAATSHAWFEEAAAGEMRQRLRFQPSRRPAPSLPIKRPRARREHRHPKASKPGKSLPLDPLENKIGRLRLPDRPDGRAPSGDVSADKFIDL
jgi:P27 family predicted phage terminase small subunit